MHASQENFGKYEGIFQDIIGKEDIPIRFEVSERGDMPEEKDPNLRILFLISVPVFFDVVAYYLWSQRK